MKNKLRVCKKLNVLMMLPAMVFVADVSQAQVIVDRAQAFAVTEDQGYAESMGVVKRIFDTNKAFLRILGDKEHIEYVLAGINGLPELWQDTADLWKQRGNSEGVTRSLTGLALIRQKQIDLTIALGSKQSELSAAKKAYDDAIKEKTSSSGFNSCLEDQVEELVTFKKRWDLDFDEEIPQYAEKCLRRIFGKGSR